MAYASNKFIDDWTCNELQKWTLSILIDASDSQKINKAIAEQEITGKDLNSLESNTDVIQSFPEISINSANKIYNALLRVRKNQPQYTNFDTKNNEEFKQNTSNSNNFKCVDGCNSQQLFDLVKCMEYQHKIDLIQRMDEAIGRYYILKGTWVDVCNYYNPDDSSNKGKFFSFCQKYGINDYNIEETIYKQSDCVLTAFDNTVPGAPTNKTVYELIKRCYLSCKNEQNNEYESKQDDNEDKQECLIDSNNDRRQPIYSSPNKDDAIIKCIGSLRIEYITGISYPPEKLIGTGTVIDIDTDNYCYVLTVAHNAQQILRECKQCTAKTLKMRCPAGHCNGNTKKIIPTTFIEADTIQFERRCIKQEIKVKNETFRFGQIMKSYHINYYKIRDNLYKHFSNIDGGYDVCIMKFECKDSDEIEFYKLCCNEVQLVCDPFLGVSKSYLKALKHNGIAFDKQHFNKSILNIYGYPGDKYHGLANNKQYEMWGMSTSPIKMKVETHSGTGKSYICNFDIDTTPGQSGSCIYTSHKNNGKEIFTIYGIHSGAKSHHNVATFLDNDNLKWIQQQIFGNNKNKIYNPVSYVFDAYHGDKNLWKFKNNNRCIEGNDILFGWYYCVYLSLECVSKYGGVYYVSVKYVNGLHLSGHAPCCIGVISKRSKSNGIWYSKRWPNIGTDTASSYFDGLYEKPFWKKSESITIKLDLNKFIVSYYKSNQLIKQKSIPKRKRYYFMMCANAHTFYKFKYSINC
eukprot:104496_1